MSAHLIDSIGWTLLHFVWEGALIGCATALGLVALRHAQPGARYLLACSALLACLLLPAAELALRLHDGAATASHMRFADELVRRGVAGNGAGLLDLLQSKLAWIVAFWALCAMALSLRMALGLLWIRRAASATPASPAWQRRARQMARQFGIGRSVTLRIVDDLASPLTAGWWRPVILLPASLASGMPPALLEALLAHEMAHVRRLDYAVNLAQNVVEILLFYHPAVWWLSHRIRVEREQLADDLAAAHLGEPRRLAQALSELERMQFADHHLAMAATGGDLLDRVKRLLQPQRTTLNWNAALPALGLAIACLSVLAHANPQSERTVVRTAAVVDFSSCRKPIWPASSLAAEHTGTVTLGFHLSAEGRVIESRLHGSSGDPLLDEAARVGIMKCRFKPGTAAGQPVASWMRMRYVWQLK